MVKPIALMYYPCYYFQVGEEKQNISDVIISFNKAIPDYHWLCFPKEDIETPELQVFFEKDFTQIQYDELMGKIKNKVL